MTAHPTRDTFAFLFTNESRWLLFDAEDFLCSDRSRAEAIKSAESFEDHLDQVFQCDPDGVTTNVSEDIAREMFSTWLDDAESGDAPNEFVQRHVTDWQERLDDALTDRDEDATHVRAMSSPELTGRI